LNIITVPSVMCMYSEAVKS